MTNSGAFVMQPAVPVRRALRQPCLQFLRRGGRSPPVLHGVVLQHGAVGLPLLFKDAFHACLPFPSG